MLKSVLLWPILPGFRAGLFQELPKYLRGYHKCSKDEAVQLAGLIYKVHFNNDRTQLAAIPKILKELVPENLLRAVSPDEWKKVRTSAFLSHIYIYRALVDKTHWATLHFWSDGLWKYCGGMVLDIVGFPSTIARGFASYNPDFTYSIKVLKDICRPGWLIWSVHLSQRY